MQISFILAEPVTPENVGSVARTLKTMGFDDLRLINRCDSLNTPLRYWHMPQMIFTFCTHSATNIYKTKNNGRSYATLNYYNRH